VLVCLILDKPFTDFFPFFANNPGHRKNAKGKSYLAVDLPVYKEADRANFVLVKD